MESEYRTYIYIEETLKSLGWDTRTPQRGGAVYTQGEFRKHDRLLSDALGIKAPENIVRIAAGTDFQYWVIEAKREHRQLQQALKEAKAYADKINTLSSRKPKARFATGIAGTPGTSFYVITSYWNGAEWLDVSINDYDTTGFLSCEQCKSIIAKNNPKIADFVIDLDAFLKSATAINESLHKTSVEARDRARFVSALLLALVDDPVVTISDQLPVLAQDINTRIKNLLTRHGKEAYFSKACLEVPESEGNHPEYWMAIVKTLQHLREMNIRSAVNSGDDALGKFYETFLKYANDASEMGIVLTPRHITRFAVESVKIKHNDTVFDPACGTGGFLVAALDQIRVSHNIRHPSIYNTFKQDGLWGVEKSPNVYGLALVNMIFRGDGKSQIYNGDCFDYIFRKHNGQTKQFKKGDTIPEGCLRPFSRVLMNPPFAVESKPREFVDYALDHMQPNGILFSVLPNSPITASNNEDLNWRREMVKRHTVKACIKFPETLFLPSASKGTYGLIIEAWVPHEPKKDVFFADLFDDNHASNITKAKSLSTYRDNMEDVLKGFHNFTSGKSVEPVAEQIGVSTLNLDGLFDFAPEAYLGDSRPENMAALHSAQNLQQAIIKNNQRVISLSVVPDDIKGYGIDDIFDICKGRTPPLKELLPGETPVITTKEVDNGIRGYYEVEKNLITEGGITISANGSGGCAFWHPYSHAVSGDVLQGVLKHNFPNDPEFYLYVCEAIKRSSWRFNYYRKCSAKRLMQDVRIPMPMKNGKIDMKMIRLEVGKTPGFDFVMERINENKKNEKTG